MSASRLVIEDRRQVERILGVIGDAYDLVPRLLLARTNAHYISRPRMIAFWLLRQRKWSLPRIGKALGGLHHTTVLHGIQAVESQLAACPDFRDTVLALQARSEQAEIAVRQAAARPLGRVDVLEARIASLEAMLALSGGNPVPELTENHGE